MKTTTRTPTSQHKYDGSKPSELGRTHLQEPVVIYLHNPQYTKRVLCRERVPPIRRLERQ